MTAGGMHADAVTVRKLNEIFYDVEAEQYDERHPEVIEGDAQWWRSRSEQLIGALRSDADAPAGLRILDVGCGTGFVAGVVAEHLRGGDLVVGIDQSEGMLGRARAKAAGGAGPCRFARGDAASLQFRGRSFHMVTVNSFLHHVYDYRAVLREIDRVLRPGGYLLLGHEPNREFFRSPFIRLAASAYKLAGLGMKVPRDLCEKINVRLRESDLAAAEVGAADILRLVEYHSPVEQRAIGIDKRKGFSPRELLDEPLRGYAVVELNEYSTFFHRPLLERNPWLMRVARSGAGLFKGKGNLFSAVLRKPTAAAGAGVGA